MSADAPLSRKITVAALPKEGEVVRIEANKNELSAMAEAYAIPQIRRFVADFRLRPEGKAGANLRGAIDVEMDRICVVSLESFPVALREPVELTFAPARPAPEQPARQSRDKSGKGRDLDDEIELDVMFDGDDPPEPIENGVIDLGAVACEFFALSLDPYPRKPGVEFQSAEAADGKEPAKVNPFAVLARLKDKSS
jgi:uncharacterized metal-binding protein YceD (DUF177 family)